VIDYWSQFARSGDPNRAGHPAWQRFKENRPRTQALASGPDGIGDTDFATDHHYRFWNALNR
jgi:para-nitrobenzyl esterase